MDFQILEELIESMPEVIEVELFGHIVDAKLEEYGQGAGGCYVVLETRSPEGYQTKFSLFDEDIGKIRGIWFAVMAIETGENGRQLAISKHDYRGAAIKAAERYYRPGSHYKHIEVWKLPEKIVIWRDGLKLSS